VQTYSLDIPVHSLGAEEALFYIAPESVVDISFCTFSQTGGYGPGDILMHRSFVCKVTNFVNLRVPGLPVLNSVEVSDLASANYIAL